MLKKLTSLDDIMASLPPERRRRIEAETAEMLAEIELREAIERLAADAAEAIDLVTRRNRTLRVELRDDAGRTFEIKRGQNAEDVSAWLGLGEKDSRAA